MKRNVMLFAATSLFMVHMTASRAESFRDMKPTFGQLLQKGKTEQLSSAERDRLYMIYSLYVRDSTNPFDRADAQSIKSPELEKEYADVEAAQRKFDEEHLSDDPRLQEEAKSDYAIKLTFYLISKKCAENGWSFNDEITGGIEALVKKKSKVIPQQTKDLAWQKLQSVVATTQITPTSCAADMRQAQYSFPADIFEAKNGPKNPF